MAKQLLSDVDAFCVKEHDAHEDGFRRHLGASVIGSACLSKVWRGYRWMSKEVLNGWKVRLFERGHNAETRFAHWLTGIGFHLETIDPATLKQYVYSAVHGHYGGSFDGVGTHPSLPWPVLVECKTHNSKSFVALVNQGLHKAKPQHYKQMCAYGKAFGLQYGLYVAINKNDDALHFELVWLDWELGAQLEMRAEELILARKPPPKISKAPTHFECRICQHVDVCHYNGIPLKNCRTCEQSYPTEGGEWYCAHYAAIIPHDVAKTGCADNYVRLV